MNEMNYINNIVPYDIKGNHKAEVNFNKVIFSKRNTDYFDSFY